MNCNNYATVVSVIETMKHASSKIKQIIALSEKNDKHGAKSNKGLRNINGDMSVYQCSPTDWSISFKHVLGEGFEITLMSM